MATVTGFTSQRMLEIENNTVIDGNIVGDDLILTTFGGTDINAGNVRGPQGIQGPIGEVSDAELAAALAAYSAATANIADGAVTNPKLATNAVTGVKISPATITGDKIAAGTINGSNLVNGAVGNDQIGADAVTGSKIADNAVGSEHIQSNAVGATEIANGAVSNAKIATDAVDGSKIADDAINSEHYAAGSIDNEHLSTNSVTKVKIADDSVTYGKILKNNGIAYNTSTKVMTTSWTTIMTTASNLTGEAGSLLIVTASVDCTQDDAGGGPSDLAKFEALIDGTYVLPGQLIWRPARTYSDHDRLTVSKTWIYVLETNHTSSYITVRGAKNSNTLGTNIGVNGDPVYLNSHTNLSWFLLRV